MTTTLRPHDFYVKLTELVDKKAMTADSETLEYLLPLLEKWDKCRFAETNELGFAYLRNWAIDNAPDVSIMTSVVELIDGHIEEQLTFLSPEHRVFTRKAIGIPEPVKEESKPEE